MKARSAQRIIGSPFIALSSVPLKREEIHAGYRQPSSAVHRFEPRSLEKGQRVSHRHV